MELHLLRSNLNLRVEQLKYELDSEKIISKYHRHEHFSYKYRRPPDDQTLSTHSPNRIKWPASRSAFSALRAASTRPSILACFKLLAFSSFPSCASVNNCLSFSALDLLLSLVYYFAPATTMHHSQLAPLPSDVPFRIVSKTIGQGAYAW